MQEGREGTGHGGIRETGRQTRKNRGERAGSVFIVFTARLMLGEGNFGVAHEPLGHGEKAA